MLFSASDGTDPGGNLWRTDATTSGTRLVRDINPDGYNDPTYLTAVGGTVYFRVIWQTAAGEDYRLWRSDGTSAGTRLVGGVDLSYPMETGVLNGRLYFSARDPTHGVELWRSDGTAAGTRLVRDINPGAMDSDPSYFTEMNGILYFNAHDELWRSDGTAAGTRLVRAIWPAAPHLFTPMNGRLYFRALDPSSDDPTTPGQDYALWRTDGTAAGTSPIRRTNGSEVPVGDLTEMNGTLYFSAADAAHGYELWRSDGTAAGTRLVRDICPGSPESNPQWLTAAGGKLFFTANDGTHGREPWVSDGTSAGTRLLRDINPDSAPPPGESLSDPSELTAVGGTLYFRAVDSRGEELWQSDGTPTGTTQVRDIFVGPKGSRPASLTSIGGTLYFDARDWRHGYELWKAVP